MCVCTVQEEVENLRKKQGAQSDSQSDRSHKSKRLTLSEKLDKLILKNSQEAGLKL